MNRIRIIYNIIRFQFYRMVKGLKDYLVQMYIKVHLIFSQGFMSLPFHNINSYVYPLHLHPQ